MFVNDIIWRQDAIELAMQYCPDDDGTCSKADEDMRNLLDELEALPTAQPQQKTGRWISERREWEYTLRCSECGYTYTPRGLEDGTLDQADIHHYCPLCGTKMDRW